MDLVSIIVPVYKTEQYLARCVNSILNQSYSNVEIILVDDGSPDGCPRLCNEFEEKYSNVKAVHKENGGLSSARNAGLDVCKGNYISFIDSDDFIEKDFIKRLYDSLIKYNADVAMVQYAQVASESSLPCVKPQKEKVYEESDVEKAFLKLKIDSVCVGLYRAQILEKQRFIEGKTSEDIPFNFDVFRKIKTFIYIPEKRYYYYYNSESISNGPLDKNMLNYLEFRKKIYEYYSAKTPELGKMSEALYARAAMGLQTRMALYGISKELDERECVNTFNNVFKLHRKAFFEGNDIPISRKIIAVIVFKFYKIIRLLRK